jgi:hypothetical protein
VQGSAATADAAAEARHARRRTEKAAQATLAARAPRCSTATASQEAGIIKNFRSIVDTGAHPSGGT